MLPVDKNADENAQPNRGKESPHTQKLTEVNKAPPPVANNPMRIYDPYMPGYARAGLLMPRMPHASVNQRSQGRGGEKPRKVISFTSEPLNENIKLHESQNPWIPLHKCKTLPDENEKVKRSVLGVLNKLTPQKFETLLAQIKSLRIDTEEKLTSVRDLVFEKAVYEPKFCVVYANLSKHLALIKVPVSGTSGTLINFRNLLLTKCQKEFEKDRRDELEEKMKTLEAADPNKRKELELEYEEEERKIRYRKVGNVKLLAELFKLGMLIEPIMHECIKKLLSQGDEISFECLSVILKTVGKDLDVARANEITRMDIYFGQMKLIIDKRLTSSRIRFMLQDVIDLKKNNWVPRRNEDIPKTIDQIHKEAERETREQQQAYQNMTNYPKRISDDRDRRKNAGLMDGYAKSSKGSYSVVDPSRLKLTKPDEVEAIRLGPGGRGLPSWGRGSSGGTKTTADADKTALTNRFSALVEQSLSSNYEGRKGSQRSAASSCESSRGRNSQLPPAIRKTPSTSKERENLLETVKGITITAEAKASEAKSTTDVQVNGKAVTTEESALNGPEYNEDDMERKTKPLIDDFLHNSDFEKLEFTVSPIKVNPQTQMSMEEMKKHLLSLLEKNAELEEVFDWVDANISDTNDPTFVRALVTVVHENCLSGSGTSWELNTSKLKSIIPLISRYVSTNEKLQLQALYAVQALMNQLGQPSGLLHQIFDVLYDDDVISDEAFKEWDQSDDPNEVEGKGVAVHSVKSFFTWLQEPEEEAEEMSSV